jgi:Glycosyltransferase family 87
MRIRGFPGWLPAFGYGACAVFAMAVVLVSTQPLHRRWGACAVIAYGCAALVWVTRARWRAELAAGLTVAGALVVPLCWLAVSGQGMPEVGVVVHSAQLLVEHGRPYQSAAQLGADVNGYNPYLPGMAVFGLPRALFGGGLASDPRVWDGVAFAASFWAALRVAGVSDPVRRTAVLAGTPLIAFPLAVSGNDLPVVGLLCLGLALAARQDTGTVIGPAVAAGVVLGAAAALKATAWPGVLVAGLLFAGRDGGRTAARFAAATAMVLAAVVGPFLVIQPRDLVENTIAFPLGLTRAHSPAASPLPGHLLAATGEAGHLAVIGLMAAATAGLAAALLWRPPQTAMAAAAYLALILTLLFTLAPATRWGYFVYPLGIGSWLLLPGLARPGTPVAPPRITCDSTR